MTPTIVMDETQNRAVLGLGSPGGTRIPGQVNNVLLNMLIWDTALQAAVDAVKKKKLCTQTHTSFTTTKI